MHTFRYAPCGCKKCRFINTDTVKAQTQVGTCRISNYDVLPFQHSCPCCGDQFYKSESVKMLELIISIRVTIYALGNNALQETYKIYIKNAHAGNATQNIHPSLHTHTTTHTASIIHLLVDIHGRYTACLCFLNIRIIIQVKKGL